MMKHRSGPVLFWLVGIALTSLSWASSKADDARDYLVQKVCVDAGGRVLPADPYNPPSGSILRSLRVGEDLPYNKHDQPGPGHPDGYQRHDSYPVLDRNGNEIVVNPFYFDSTYSGNGFDIYMIRNGWASAGETRDGGGFATTFWGEQDGTIVPYNGWPFFPVTALGATVTDGLTKRPITGQYWEHNGIPWHSVVPKDLFDGSETSWKFIKNCSFGGIDGSAVKRIDTIQSVHGYVSKGNRLYESNMRQGHLEVFYFTKLYGVTRWEDWAPIGQLNGVNKPSGPRSQAIATATNAAKPMPEANQWLAQPTDLPTAPGNQYLATSFAGQDGIEHTYAMLDVRDWSAVTILPAPQAPPPCPNACQNLLINFHFDRGSMYPWKTEEDDSAGRQDGLKSKLSQSQATLDRQDVQNGAGGVRYLQLVVPTAAAAKKSLYQDILVTKLKDGTYTFSAKMRSNGGTGSMRLSVQQIDSGGNVLATSVEATCPVTATNSNHDFSGDHDSRPNASVYLASTVIAARGTISISPQTYALRVALQPQTPGTFDIVEADLSATASDSHRD